MSTPHPHHHFHLHQCPCLVSKAALQHTAPAQWQLQGRFHTALVPQPRLTALVRWQHQGQFHTAQVQQQHQGQFRTALVQWQPLGLRHPALLQPCLAQVQYHMAEAQPHCPTGTLPVPMGLHRTALWLMLLPPAQQLFLITAQAVQVWVAGKILMIITTRIVNSSSSPNMACRQILMLITVHTHCKRPQQSISGLQGNVLLLITASLDCSSNTSF